MDWKIACCALVATLGAACGSRRAQNPEAERRADIEVFVVDDEGKPADGAKVYWTQAASPSLLAAQGTQDAQSVTVRRRLAGDVGVKVEIAVK